MEHERGEIEFNALAGRGFGLAARKIAALENVLAGLATATPAIWA
jgi:hypothetical protein